MNKYVSELSKASQHELYHEVLNTHLNNGYSLEIAKELTQDAMNSRLSDLTDTVPSYFLEALD